MRYKHQFGKDGFFGRGEVRDMAPRKKTEPAKQVNPARDNIPLSHPRYKQRRYA